MKISTRLRSTARRNDSRLQPSLVRVTPSVVSETLIGVDRFPNLLSFYTYCVCLELRPLPSTSITWLPRYCEPLRHAKGLPVLRALPLCACCRHYPGAATEDTLRSFPQSYQPSPIGSSGRPARCPFRGLLSVYSRYGLHTRWIAYSVSLHRRLQPFRYLHDCSDCFRPDRFSRVGLSPTGKAPP